MINVVYSNGQNHGALNSLNITSTIQINDILTKNPKIPSVIILNGRVIMSNMGFTKKLRRPNMIPKVRIICQSCVMGNPKKFEPEITATLTPGTYSDASHSPAPAAMILKRRLRIFSYLSIVLPKHQPR